MSTVSTINNALATQYSDMVHLASNQTKSRLRNKVKVIPQDTDTMSYDGLEGLEAVEVTSRNQKTQGQDINHTRRRIRTRRFTATILLDPKDDVETIIDPKKPYAAETAKALYRQFDRICVEAAFADVYTGRDFDTTKTFAQDGGLTVDATAGLTYEKLLEASQNFIDNEVGTEMEEDIFFAHSGDEHTAMMKETELTSGDYVRDFAIEKGKIVRVLGWETVAFGGNMKKPILSVNSGTRDCVVASTRGIVVGVSKELTVKISERDDLNYSTQVFAEMIMGATRTEGTLVQKFQTTAS